MTKKKFWDNSSLQQDIQWDNQQLPGLTDEELYSTNWNLHWTKSDKTKQRISDSMRGKTLEELLGEERAAKGRQTRSDSAKGPREKEVVDKIVTTKKQNGVYDSPTHGMRGKTHKDETKSKQSVKAQIRQELKRRLGLGKNDSVPKDILEQEYKKHNL